MLTCSFIPALLPTTDTRLERSGVLECWSAGVLDNPTLHHSATPSLRFLSWLTLLTLLLAGCTTPIGATRTSLRVAYRQAKANALDGQASSQSRLVLHRFDLDKLFASNPAEALRTLHEKACQDNRRDLVFALGELSFIHAYRLERSVKAGEPRKARDYYLSAAIYSYLYLFGPGWEPPPTKFDDRFSIACDVYNAGLAKGLGFPERTNAVVVLEAGRRQLPPGPVEVSLDTNAFPIPLGQFQTFLSSDQFLIRGFSLRDRQSGLGAPLIAVAKPIGESPLAQRSPATVFARPTGDLQAWKAGQLGLTLELYSSYGSNLVQVGDATIPLQTDLTAPVAQALNQDFVWRLGMGQFFSSVEMIKSDVYLAQPYQPGRVPIVFVHGTFSSPIWWAEMMNTLRSDPDLRQHCQFWYFIYNSGNPVAYSAVKLRECLTAKLKELDPEGRDPALRQMVVIGHSQGGLLTKLTATETGDQLWRVLRTESLDNAKLTDAQRELIRRYTVFEPLPFVKRVVFLSTPHRGSYLASNFVRRFIRRFVALPGTLIQQANEFTGLTQNLHIQGLKGVPTSLDSMSPRNKYLLKLADIPTGPGIPCHSIIAVNGNGDYHQGKDGLVSYASAHVDYAASEFIVRSGHSCQDKPPTIEEVRRVLLEHLSTLPEQIKAPAENPAVNR
jgi:pimeloyl-ACP methyl ester carboxylesterase